jgi:hypothetical protein
MGRKMEGQKDAQISIKSPPLIPFSLMRATHAFVWSNRFAIEPVVGIGR